MAQLLLAHSFLGRHVNWHLLTWKPGHGACGMLWRLQYVLSHSGMGHTFASPLWAAAANLLVAHGIGQNCRILSQALKVDQCVSPMGL